MKPQLNAVRKWTEDDHEHTSPFHVLRTLFSRSDEICEWSIGNRDALALGKRDFCYHFFLLTL